MHLPLAGARRGDGWLGVCSAAEHRPSSITLPLSSSSRAGGRGGPQTFRRPPPQQPAAGPGSAAERERKHVADRLAQHWNGPGIYIPTAEEAAAIERRNWATLATLLAAAGGAYYAFWKKNATAQVGPGRRPPAAAALVLAGVVRRFKLHSICSWWFASCNVTDGCKPCSCPEATPGESQRAQLPRPAQRRTTPLHAAAPPAGQAAAGAGAAGQLERHALGDGARAVPARDDARAGGAGGAGAR